MATPATTYTAEPTPGLASFLRTSDSGFVKTSDGGFVRLGGDGFIYVSDETPAVSYSAEATAATTYTQD